MVRLLCLALVLGGCHAVFGLDEVDLGPDSTRVEGTYVVREVTNDPNFAPMVTESYAADTEIEMVAVLDDGTPTAVAYDESTGAFSFPVATTGQSYRLQVTFNGVTAEYQHSTSQLRIGSNSAGHVERRAVQPTYISFNYASPTARPAQIATTGLYTQTDTGMVGPTVTFDWRLAVPAGGGFTGMLDASRNDVAYAIETELGSGITSPQWMRYRAVSSMTITQAPNATATLPPPAVQAPNTCFHVTTAAAEEITRIYAAQPRDYAGSSGDWIAFAVPAPDATDLAGAIYTGLSSFAPAVDLDITPDILDPFPGASLVVEAGAAQSFYMQLLGASAIPAANISRVYARPQRGTPPCAFEATALTPTVGIPGEFALAGVGLDADNTMVAIADDTVPALTWSIVSPGPVQLAGIQLYELTNVNGTTTPLLQWSALVPGTSARLDPSTLVSGHTYAVLVATQIGRPEYADGDALAITFPMESSSIWTHTFIVQ